MKKLTAIILVFTVIFSLVSCDIAGTATVSIVGGDEIEMTVGSSIQLECEITGVSLTRPVWSVSGSRASVTQDGKFNAWGTGTVTVTVTLGNSSDTITVIVLPVASVNPDGDGNNGSDSTGGEGNGSNDGTGGGAVTPPPDTDEEENYDEKYANMSRDEFYSDYTPAVSYTDAYYRSKYGFMSGTITLPKAAPVISSYQPSHNGMLIRNTDMVYADGGNTYIVYDAFGNEAMRIYRGGGYVVLEEVAAYMFAFGEIPANYSSKKKPTVTTSPWGEYLRGNHSYFYNDSSSYPDEPALPNSNGNGGDLQYMEMDIGIGSYNNGNKISRGSCRIVYARNDVNGNGIYEFGELHLFYTYNHYEDFQEYLNYYGGWGEIFGYETGGSIPGKPSPYVSVYMTSLSPSSVTVVWFDYRREWSGV